MSISHLSLADSVMTKIDLVPLPPFDPHSDPSFLSQWWKIWTKHFQTYIVAMNITNDKQNRALLLYQAGEATQEILETLPKLGKTMLQHKPN